MLFIVSTPQLSAMQVWAPPSWGEEAAPRLSCDPGRGLHHCGFRKCLEREHLPSIRAQKIFFPSKSIGDYKQMLQSSEGGPLQGKTTPEQKQLACCTDLCNSMRNRWYNDIAEKWLCNSSTKGLSAKVIFLKNTYAHRSLQWGCQSQKEARSCPLVSL